MTCRSFRPAIIDVTAVKDRPDVELFGPMLQVIQVDDFDEAIAEANNTRFGLSASLVGGTPAGIQPVLGQCPRRDHQLEPADQRRQLRPRHLAGSAFRATTAPAPITPPTTAPIRSLPTKWNSRAR